MRDILLRAGRVLDPASGRDEVADVRVSRGRITAVGADVVEPGCGVEDAPRSQDDVSHATASSPPPSMR